MANVARNWSKKQSNSPLCLDVLPLSGVHSGTRLSMNPSLNKVERLGFFYAWDMVDSLPEMNSLT